MKFNKECGDQNIVSYLRDKNLITSKQMISIFREHDLLNDEQENIALLNRIGKVCNLNSDIKPNIRFRGRGCEHCNSGIVGRTVVSETLTPDDHLLELIGEGNIIAAKNHWRIEQQGRTALEDAIIKMIDGIVDPRDIEEAFKELDKVNNI
jgi:type II secretory ATPase GspE/PulE/Tfp pilus assembly ATPase PilB-like protein